MDSTVNTLNTFLRGEKSAVETYKKALDTLGSNPKAQTLSECLKSHEQRVAILEAEVKRRGGEPAHSSGAWGTFANIIQGASNILGEKAAISALEEGEDHGRDDYKRHMDDLDTDARSLVESKLLPESLRTHDTVSTMKKSLS